MKNNAQLAYNKLASVQQYLLWFNDLDHSERFASIENQQLAAIELMDIIKDAKHLLLEEQGREISVSQAWDYSDKWQEFSEFSRAIATRIREALRPVLGYV